VSEFYDQFVSALRGIPALPSPQLCRNRSAMFDATDEIAAQPAIRLCGQCVALQACGDWLDSLPPSKRPPGVTAGRAHDPDSRRKAKVS
jgi:hypothetical protein